MKYILSLLLICTQFSTAHADDCCKPLKKYEGAIAAIKFDETVDQTTNELSFELQDKIIRGLWIGAAAVGYSNVRSYLNGPIDPKMIQEERILIIYPRAYRELALDIKKIISEVLSKDKKLSGFEINMIPGKTPGERQVVILVL